ncbi:MAG: AMP-binding protein, partial [Chloroflexota bacterium]|nr:AMP-binding protein [Chloroflexota bacterium]
RDSRDVRLKTSGKVIDFMNVRLYDDEGRDITTTKRPGQPACRGPLTCIGYYDDPKANAELFAPDGWMLTGDMAEIDADGYIHLVGRKSDFIIRGGKNISAPAVEEEVSSHPAVAMVACVSMPDSVFGERVCAYIVLRDGQALTLDGLARHLQARGVSREWFPERLVFVDRLPTSSGGKVAKAELRADIRRRLLEGRG